MQPPCRHIAAEKMIVHFTAYILWKTTVSRFRRMGCKSGFRRSPYLMADFHPARALLPPLLPFRFQKMEKRNKLTINSVKKKKDDQASPAHKVHVPLLM